MEGLSNEDEIEWKGLLVAVGSGTIRHTVQLRSYLSKPSVLELVASDAAVSILVEQPSWIFD